MEAVPSQPFDAIVGLAYFWPAFLRVMRGDSTSARELGRAGLRLTAKVF